MSPEQATGDRVIDARTDVYSLGAVLYEMLTGEPPHTGTTAQAIIARVLTDKPRTVRQTRETVPSHVDAAVERALAKLPADRFATAREFADTILGRAVVLPRDIITPSSLVSARRTRAQRIARASLMVAPWILVAGLAAMLLAPRREPPVPTTRFAVSLPASARLITTTGGFIEVAPTGDGFVYVAQSESGPRLFYRATNEEDVRPVPGTDNGAQPFMSPDGEWVGFIADGKIKKVALRSGTAQTVGDLGSDSPTGFAWGADGRIVYGRLGGGLMQVSADGGTPAPLTTIDPGETSHRGPVFLSDNRTVLFVAWGASPDDGRIAFVLKNGDVRRMSQHAMRARQVAHDLIAFSNSQGTIFAAPFDPSTFEIGNAVAMEAGVFVRASGFSGWGASTNGSLVLLRGEPSARMTLVNRAGTATALAGDIRSFGHPRVSPDGQRIAVHIGVGGPGTGDIWIYSLASETLSRLTFGGGNSDPLWTKDGGRLLFSGRAGPNNPENDLFWQSADGSAQAERLFTSPGRQWASGWSADGQTVVLDELVRGSTTRLSALRLADTSARAIVQAPAGAMVRFPSLSPDGRFMAYASNESGRMEVYVTQFPGPGGKWQVSTRGGDEPLWSRNGREIFFRDNAYVVAARVATTPTFSVMTRAPLFEDTYMRGNTVNWDVMADDQRFVMLRAADQSAQLVVATNWDDEARRRLRGPIR
jgi:hypothetical protein